MVVVELPRRDGQELDTMTDPAGKRMEEGRERKWAIKVTLDASV